MKKTILLFSLILTSFVQYAQTGNVVISSESGELIYVSINGVKQNKMALANVEITGLKPPSTAITITFENITLSSTSGTINVIAGHELTYKMKKNNAQWQFMLLNDMPMADPKIGLADPREGLQQLPPPSGIESTSTSVIQPNITLASATISPAGGCGAAMATAAFAAAKSAIVPAASEVSKLSAAKQLAQNNCLSSTQITDVMQMLTSESSKLDFTKFAFDHISDKNNYTNVINSFSSEAVKKELNNFIMSKKTQ
jgi:Domain of unknown function (DUF4476)